MKPVYYPFKPTGQFVVSGEDLNRLVQLADSLESDYRLAAEWGPTELRDLVGRTTALPEGVHVVKA